MKALLTISFVLISLFSFSQEDNEKHQLDSLNRVISSNKNDSIKIIAMSVLEDYLFVSEPEKSYQLDKKIVLKCINNLKKTKLSKKSKLFYNGKLASAYNNIGIYFKKKGEYSKAITYHFKALKINQIYKIKKELSSTYNCLGNAYSNQGDYPKSLTYYFKSLKIDEELDDKYGVSVSLNNIALIYQNQGNYDDALKYYNKALEIDKVIGDSTSIAYSYINIGNFKTLQNDYDGALEYFNIGLKMVERLDDKFAIASVLMNMGVIAEYQKDYPKALEYFLHSMKELEMIGDQNGIGIAYSNIASTYKQLKNFAKSKEYYEKALALSKLSGYKEAIQVNFQGLSFNDSALGNYKGAFLNYKNYIAYRDSLLNEENTKKTVETKMQYEFDKKTAKDSIAKAKEKEIHVAEIAKQDAEIKARRIQQYLLFGGLAIVFIFAGFIYSRFRISQKQKKIIESQKKIVEHQKELVDEKQKEIIDSINYAKRLQQAILARPEEIKKYLPQSFLLYKPKDIVAGDFYFFEVTEDYIFYAAADSTGHGVPGAMVSVVCSNALSRSVREFKLTETGKILDKTRELVVETFEKSGENVKDGMDISFLSIDRRTNEIKWSGANNPLWYIDQGVMHEIKPDKQPIGKMDNPKSFTTNILPKSISSLYLFTDGYADQFGGPKGKKFKYSSLQNLLVENANQDSQKISEKLETTFDQWKAELEQVDDVCIIGIKL